MLTARVAMTSVSAESPTHTGSLSSAMSSSGFQMALPNTTEVAEVMITAIAEKPNIVVGSATAWPIIWARCDFP